jgi:two-component system LytT family response regulator
MHILIVDDEPPARKKIRACLAGEENIVSISEAENGPAAVQHIRQAKPDLVFLDIQMPGMNGFEVIETIGVENMPAVIFVTAYDQYAIEAFEIQALDYLLKPFDQERFRKSFRRAWEQIQLKSAHAGLLARLLENIHSEKKYSERILVNKGPRFFFVKTAAIAFVSAEEKYVLLHAEDGSFLIRETMRNMEQRLDPQKFARIHRSYIVNIDFIREIQPWSHGDGIVILKTGKELPLSRRYRDRVFGKG